MKLVPAATPPETQKERKTSPPCPPDVHFILMFLHHPDVLIKGVHTAVHTAVSHPNYETLQIDLVHDKMPFFFPSSVQSRKTNAGGGRREN